MKMEGAPWANSTVPTRLKNLVRALRMTMDFDQAIASHAAWKRRLSHYLNKPDQTLQPGEISPDNKCDLGKWIFEMAVQYGKFPEYSRLREEHSRFHKAAADIVQRANAGEKVTEEIALGAKSEFSAATTAVVQAIMAMKLKRA
jgi:methyl-accepting chemotaxis protein